MKAEKKTSIVLADEQTLLCGGIAAICERTRQFRVVGHCADGRSAVQMIRSLAPEIAILDLGLPNLVGLAVVQKVRQSGHSPKILVLSVRGDRKTALETLRSGANGYLLKSDPAGCLLDALRAIQAGSIYISPQLKLADVFARGKAASRRKAYEKLSAREHQVFRLLVGGLSNKEIAVRLDINPKTVSSYRTGMMSKLRVYDLAGLVRYAIRQKLLSLS
jgi:DNA-binding NarL/FixJ family response regulator